MNSVCLIGNLTKDPEVNVLKPNDPDGAVVCSLRLAVNGRRKVNGEWVDVPNYFNVTLWGRQAELAGEHLARGRQIAVQGRLQWHDWEKDDGTRGQSVEIVAENIDYLAKPKGPSEPGSGDPEPEAAAVAATDDIPY